MTIVCAARWHGVTYLGSDSQITHEGGHRYASTYQKWIIGAGGYAIGASGDLIVTDLLRKNAASILDLSPTADVIIDRLRKVFEQWKPKEDTAISMIIVTPDGLYERSRDWALLPINDGALAAIGSGCEYAIGAFHALWTSRQLHGADLPECVERAVSVAIHYDVHCGGDIIIRDISSRLGDSMEESDAVRPPNGSTHPRSEESLATVWPSVVDPRYCRYGEADLDGQSIVDFGRAGIAADLPSDCEG